MSDADGGSAHEDFLLANYGRRKKYSPGLSVDLASTKWSHRDSLMNNKRAEEALRLMQCEVRPIVDGKEEEKAVTTSTYYGLKAREASGSMVIQGWLGNVEINPCKKEKEMGLEIYQFVAAIKEPNGDGEYEILTFNGSQFGLFAVPEGTSRHEADTAAVMQMAREYPDIPASAVAIVVREFT